MMTDERLSSLFVYDAVIRFGSLRGIPYHRPI